MRKGGRGEDREAASRGGKGGREREEYILYKCFPKIVKTECFVMYICQKIKKTLCNFFCK